MSTKSKHKSVGKVSEKDMDTFRHLPKKTKKLMMLKEQEEKSAGSEQVETAQEIEDND